MISHFMRGGQGASGKPRRIQTGKEVPLYIPTRARPVAGVTRRKDGAVELHKVIYASTHLVSLPRGIAFDSGVYAEAERLGITQICVKDRETGAIYRSTAENFRRHAFHQDRGYGKQLFLRLEFWSINGAKAEAVQVAERQAAQRGENQLGLFVPGTEVDDE